jgi:hypothetical protein
MIPLLLTTDELVDEIFADGRVCMLCPHQHKEREPHGEVLRHCRVLDARDYEGCPGLEDAR